MSSSVSAAALTPGEDPQDPERRAVVAGAIKIVGCMAVHAVHNALATTVLFVMLN